MENLGIILLVVLLLALIAVIIYCAVKGKKNIIYKMLYALVCEAEEQFGAGTGKQKFAYVLEKGYEKLPSLIKIFITYEMLEKWIEEAVTKMKEDLAEKAKSA